VPIYPSCLSSLVITGLTGSKTPDGSITILGNSTNVIQSSGAWLQDPGSINISLTAGDGNPMAAGVSYGTHVCYFSSPLANTLLAFFFVARDKKLTRCLETFCAVFSFALVNGFADQPSSVSFLPSFLQPLDVVCFVLTFCLHLVGRFPVDSCRSVSLA